MTICTNNKASVKKQIMYKVNANGQAEKFISFQHKCQYLTKYSLTPQVVIFKLPFSVDIKRHIP